MKPCDWWHALIQNKRVFKMERITVRGNGQAKGLKIEGVRVIAKEGAKLGEMMDLAENGKEDLTIFIFGLPDLLRSGQEHIWIRKDRDELIQQMKRAIGRPEWVLATTFPPRDAHHPILMLFRDTNIWAAEINARNGNGTIALHMVMFYQKEGAYVIKRHRYADNIHWDQTAKYIAEEKIKGYLQIWRRRKEQYTNENLLEEQCARVVKDIEVEVKRAREIYLHDVRRFCVALSKEFIIKVETIQQEGYKRLKEVRQVNESSQE